MAIVRCLVLTAIAALFVEQVQAADVARFVQSQGHLASRMENSEWTGLRTGDDLPIACQLRTSPLGAVRIDIPAGELMLDRDTDLNLDSSQHLITLNSGRFLIKTTNEATSWKITAGATSFVCLPQSEIEFSFLETIGVNVLKGSAQLTGPKAAGEPLILNAPVEWVGNEQGGSKTVVPTDADWANKIRKRTELRHQQGMGQLIAKDAQSNSPVRLEIARYNVNVVLQPPVALVQIDQSFFNPFHRQEEGTFVFDLPEGASVSRFAMFVTPDDLIEGELIDRKRADHVYSTIVRSKRDPAILEQIGTNLFRMRVFPIFAHDEKRILLDYTVPLVADQSKYHFELPLISDLKPIGEFGISGTVHPPFRSDSISSWTHPDLKFVKQTDGRVTFSSLANNVQPPPSLSIEYRAAEDSKPTIRTFNPDNREQYFVATIPDSANLLPKTNDRPIDLLVLIDTSGSARDLSRARLVARTMVNNLRPQDRWQAGSVDVNYRAVSTEWLEPRSTKAFSTLRKLDQEFSLGESRLDTAVEESLATFTNSPRDRRRVIVYIGDGNSTKHRDHRCWDHEEFREGYANRAEFHAVKIGEDEQIGKWLQDGLFSLQGRGFTFSSSTTVLRDLFEWTLAGMPSSRGVKACHVENVSAEDLFYDQQWPHGRELHVFGLRKPAETVELKLELSDQTKMSFSLALDDAPQDESVFTGRLWAKRKVDSLTRALRNPNEEYAPIITLCQEWSLMSPYTAFLVLETEKDYQRWNISRSLRHRYWQPVGSFTESSLPESWKRRALQNANSPDRPRMENELTEKRRAGIQKTLDMAQVALSKGNIVTANTLLYAIREYASLVDGDKYESLMSATRGELRRESVLSDLKLWQSLIDRGASGPLPAITPLLLSFSHGGVNPEFEERHPHWKSLLKPAPEFDSNKVPLTEFAKVIRKATGIPVVTDQTSLAEESISEKIGIEVVRHRDMSVRSLLDLSFFNQQITLIPERYLFRITTLTEADKASRMSRQVYPVIDLIRPNVLPRPERLANPYLADDLKNRKSIESRLKKLITVEFEDLPLSDALQVLSIKMGDAAISVDKRALAEESISLKTPVSLSVDNLPASFVLDEVLQPLRLEHVNRDGVEVVTTLTEADKLLETRVYSAAGLIDESVPDPNVGQRMLQDPNWVPFGVPQGLLWGFGGMGGGGFGGGMGGGMGGMFGGGMDEDGIGAMRLGMGGGGMGGMMGGAGPDIDSGQDSGVSEIAAPLIDSLETDSDLAAAETGTFSNQPAMTPWISPVVSPFNTGATMNLIQQSTDGKWENIDGEGGSMTFHRPSFSFVIRQTQRVHKEIKETFAKLRRLPRKSRIGTAIYANRHRLDDLFAVNYGTLMNIIQQGTSAKWSNIDGEGGTLTPHTLTESLVITQTPQIHEQIDQLFAQLRKARYLAESLPWLTSLEGIDDIDTFLDRPTITDLPRNGFDPKPPAPRFADNLGLLSVRKTPSATSQRWRHLIANANSPREKTIRRLGTKLELVLPNQTLRAEGPRAAMIYLGLTLIEIEDWGDAARQVADATFPWMPHRSNEELAQLFDVKVDSQEATTTTLQLAFPSHPETYLKVTFSTQTGHPEKLQSYLEGKLKYELQFTPKTVIAVDPQGKEIERWELLVNDTIETMPSFAEGFDDFVIVQPSKPDEPLAQARRALRRGDNSVATRILADLLIQRPQQPLINFLYAWSMAGSGESDETQTRLMREALLRMASKGPSDLLRLVSASSFPSIGAGSLREVFLTIPEEQRTEDVWDKLVELAIILERYDLALTDIDRAIEVTKDESLRIRRRLLRVELLLKNRRPVEAEDAARALMAEKLSPAQLIELATIFGHAQQFKNANLFYEQYRGTNLTRSEQAQAVNSKAAWLKKGEERWRLLLTADDEGSDGQRQAVAIVILEADQPEDAEIIGKLADGAKTTAVRTQLLLHQIELTKDKQQAADIALKLYAQKQISRNRLTWLIQLLSRAGRSREVVDILEKRLRSGERLDSELLNRLSSSYGLLGRETDRTRATTQKNQRMAPDNTPANRRMLGPGGGVF